MDSNRTPRKKDRSKIFNAVLAKMTEKGKGFFIISCGAWIHPLNTVMNCYAIMFDGGIQYKFELLKNCNYRVAEVRCRHWLNLAVTEGDILSYQELIEVIKKA